MVPPVNVKILLAEDNKINQRLFVLTIGQFGFKCDLANNGMEAFEMQRDKNYDLIFMDMHMPVCDGVESTQMIRQYEAENKVKIPVYIVALSASLVAERKDECIEAGMDEYMEKPLQGQLLLSVIEKIKSRAAQAIS